MFKQLVIIFALWSYILNMGQSVQSSLYEILGVKRDASTADIKKAYRQKARESHPDKSIKNDMNVEESTLKFRAVSEAYEILSDFQSRKDYDKLGKKPSQMREHSQQQRQQQRSNSGFTFRDFFRRNNDPFQNSKKYHKFYGEYYTRLQIIDAQSRVLEISNLNHLRTLALDENDLLDRYLLLAIFDSSNQDCTDYLHYQMMYPWPFAGYTSVGDQSMW